MAFFWEVPPPFVPLLSEDFQVAVQRAFGLPLTVLAGHVGEKFRNHANSAQCSVDKYGLKLQTVAGAKGDATRTLHGAFLAALANPLSPADTTTAHASTFFCTSSRHLWEPTRELRKKLNGVLAVLLVDFTSVAVSASDGPGAARSLFVLVRALCDAST
jgi:hypothetical protein